MLHAPVKLSIANPLGFAEGSSANPFAREALVVAGVGTWRIDMVSRLATYDPLTSHILGGPASERQEPALAPVHPADRALVEANLQSSFKTGAVHDVEFRIVRPDGAVRWVRAIARPPAQGWGDPRWIDGILYDITESMELRLAQQESERAMRTLINNLPGVAYRCACTVPWTILFCSEGVEALTGHSAAELIEGQMNIIKIDQSFVRYVDTDSDHAAIVRAVINLGRNLGIRTVAEGIESRIEAERLREWGCDYGQGYLFGRAVTADEAAALCGDGIASGEPLGAFG